MEHTLVLVSDLRKRLKTFNQNLDLKIQELIREGLLTKRDNDKLKFNATATLEAFSDYSQNSSYEDVIKEELLLSLVKEYEKGAFNLITEIEQRRYSEKFLLVRANDIKQRALAEVTSTDIKKNAEPKIRQLESQLRDDVYVVLKKVSHKPPVLETLIREFEHDIMTALKSSTDFKD